MNVIVNTGPSSESCGDVPHAHPTAPGPCQCVQSASFRVPRRRGAACVGEGAGGRGSLATAQTTFQSLAEDAPPSPCPLRGCLGSQEAARCVGRPHALGPGPVALLSWGAAEVEQV